MDNSKTLQAKISVVTEETPAETPVTSPEEKKVYQKYHANFMRDANFRERQGSGV